MGSDGTLQLVMATTKYDGPRESLTATGTGFRFNEWHSVGISFGDQGQYISLDGVLVASEPRNKQKLGRGAVIMRLQTYLRLENQFLDSGRIIGGSEDSKESWIDFASHRNRKTGI